MSESLYLSIHISISTTLALVSCITVGSASGSCYGILVSMSESSLKLCSTIYTSTCLSTACLVFAKVMTLSSYHSLSYENLVTYRTVLTLGKTVGSTSSLITIIYYFGMSECLYVIINVVMTTNGTSIRCITLICASRSCYNSRIAMFECIYVIINVSITARTSIRCITLFCASRSGYNGRIAMSESFNLVSIVSITARTSIRCITLFCASRSCYNRRIAMSESCNLVSIVSITARTSVRCITLICASRSGYNRRIAMSLRSYLSLCYENLAAR